MESGKKNIILFLCLFFVFFQVSAEEDIFNHPLAPQTMAAFNAACANLSKRPIMKGIFEQEKYLLNLNRSLISSGNFIIASEHGMVWETLRPFPSTMVLSKNFIIQSRPDGRRSVISAQGNETFTKMADVINLVFTGRSQELIENFDIYFLGSAANWNMGLLPRDSVFASFITRITMNGDSSIRSIKLFEKNGDTTTYTLLNHNFPARLNDHEEAFFTIP